MHLFVNVWIKFFFLLTPFFLLSMFLAMTRDLSEQGRRQMALRVTLAIVATCIVLYFFGQWLFAVFGITLDSFRIGAGVLLFLSAVRLVQGTDRTPAHDGEGDIAVVPLAIPIAVGPATTGALLVMGAEIGVGLDRLIGFAALCAAVIAVGALLLLAASIERMLGRQVIGILSKLTGLILAALAAQMVFTGMRGFLGPA